MKRSVIKTVLVVGDNHQDIIKKYSADTKVEPYVKYRFSDVDNILNKYKLVLKELLNENIINLTPSQQDECKQLYLKLNSISKEDFYKELTKDYTIDANTNDAISDINPNAFYQNEKCYQEKLEKTDEESVFSNPFILKDGSKAYIAHYNDIDWDKMHLYNTDIYRRVWELCVNEDEPKDDVEKQIKETMQMRTNYFNSFNNCEEYVAHSCSFWTYGIATEEYYKELDNETSDKLWVSNFYNNFIKPIKDNPLLSIYEVRQIEN